MPADTSYPHFTQPENPDETVWRYVDMAKLVDFLANRKIWLTQLARLDDPFEGRPPPKIGMEMVEFLRQGNVAGSFPGEPEQAVEAAVRCTRRSVYASWWCMLAHESASMWRLYGGSHGIAIRATYRRLANSLPDDTKLGMVSYFNPLRDRPQDDVALGWAMRKHHFYKDEFECRVVRGYWRRKADQPEAVDDDFDLYPPGLPTSIDFTKLQPSLVISPMAPSWYQDCVGKLVNALSPGVDVCKSEMLPQD